MIFRKWRSGNGSDSSTVRFAKADSAVNVSLIKHDEREIHEAQKISAKTIFTIELAEPLTAAVPGLPQENITGGQRSSKHSRL